MRVMSRQALGVIDHVEGVAEAEAHEQLAALFDADVVVRPGSTHGFSQSEVLGEEVGEQEVCELLGIEVAGAGTPSRQSCRG